MVDGIDPVYFVETMLTKKETVNRIEPLAGSSHLNETNKAMQDLIHCIPCNLNFTGKADYDRHYMAVHSIKQYTCTICTGSFRRQDHLKRHVLSVHSTSKCCVCPVCTKDCKRHDVLKKHIEKRHSDKTSIFHCRECTFECNSLRDLEKHESTHRMSDRHHCPHCKTSFKRRDHMLRHIKSQHLKQFSVCPICNHMFKRRDHLVRHLREKHNRALGLTVQPSDQS